MKFAVAPFDAVTAVLTAAFVVVVAAVVVGLSIAAPGTAVVVLICAGGGLAVLVAYGFSPAAYLLSPGRSLSVVRRLFGTRRFPITTAAPGRRRFGIGGMRLLASGGVFGWYGLFWRPNSGRYRAYVTNRQRLIWCTGPQGPIVISPADPTAFLDAASQT
jgi:hypothetical protein